MKKTIYAYSGNGASQQCIRQLFRTLKFLAPDYELKTLNAAELKDGAWRDDCALLVFSGGETKKWRAELGRRGQDIVRHAVRGGMPCLTFCAGSYFAAQSTDYQSQEENIQRDDGLGFFQGVAIGPLGGKYDYNSRRFARATPILWREGEKVVPIYFNGGCAFEPYAGVWDANTVVLADYIEFDRKPAVIATQFGQGKVVMWGLHGEFPWQPMQYDPEIQHIIDKLAAAEPLRLQLMHESLTRLGLKTVSQLKVA